jgi:AcrR family transcriptional regulator
MKKQATANLTTRAAILDAAETLFAERGYFGASLREIAGLAKVNSGLMSYYFGTKVELFSQVIDRRILELFRTYHEYMDGLVADGCGPHETVAAFIRFFFELATRHGSGWGNYVRLMSCGMSVREDPAVRAIMARFSAIGEDLYKRIRKLMPRADETRLRLNLYFLESSLVFMLEDPGLLDSRTKGRYRVGKLVPVAEDMARFWMGGLAAAAR